MKRLVVRLLLALVVVLAGARSAAAAECVYNQNVQQACGALACIPADASQAHTGGHGQCGQCGPPGIDTDGTAACGGVECRADGTCAVVLAPPPVPVWPTFHLLVVEVSTSIADAAGYSYKPVVGAGYLFLGGLGTTHPVRQLDGTSTTTVPTFYFDAGATAAFAGNAQDLFVRLGLVAHVPSWPIGIRTVGLNAVYQRTGQAIWKLDLHENGDRLGPALSVGFLYNLFVEGGYVWPLDTAAPAAHHAVVVSLVYMRDLAATLLPDQLDKYVPSQYGGSK